LQDAGKNQVTLSGSVPRSGGITNVINDTASLIKDLPSESSILQAAKRNALSMLLSETQGGYVVYEYDANNENIEAINICNQKTIDASTSRWQWSYNGLGFMTRPDINSDWSALSVAITKDGEINADRILTGTFDADQVTVHGRIEATSGYIGDPTQGWDIGSKSIHNGISSMSDTSGEGTYIGVDGIKFRQSPTDPTPAAETKITRLGIDCQTTVTASGFYGKYSGSSVYTGRTGTCAAHQFNVMEGSNDYIGQSTGSFSFMAYVDGTQKAVALNFKNGILVGVSGF
jgi:hypothetical protein